MAISGITVLWVAEGIAPNIFDPNYWTQHIFTHEGAAAFIVGYILSITVLPLSIFLLLNVLGELGTIGKRFEGGIELGFVIAALALSLILDNGSSIDVDGIHRSLIEPRFYGAAFFVWFLPRVGLPLLKEAMIFIVENGMLFPFLIISGSISLYLLD